MQGRSFRAFVGLFAVAALTAGCGSTFMTASQHDGLPPAVLQAAPVADFSGAILDLPRVFFGIGYAQLRPEDSSLKTSTVYDLNVAYDLTANLTFEFSFGLWNVPDRPAGIPQGDSDLEMRPALGMLQLSGELSQLKARVYFAAGGGYSVNSYALGSKHEYHVENVDKVPDYSVRADDGFLWQLALGVELYSTADAALNFGVELRYVSGMVERVERTDETIFNVDEVELNLYLIRANVTWHF